MAAKNENTDDRIDQKRRDLMKSIGLSMGALALGGVSAFNYLIPTTKDLPVMSDYPVAVLVDQDGNPITSSQIPEASPDSTTYPIIVFNYPLQDEPNILLKLKGTSIPGGVGPEGNIIAFSGICQHLGCTVPLLMYFPHGHIPFEAELIGYNDNNWPSYGLLYCKCHGSQYNPLGGANNLYNSGPAPSPANHSLPTVSLYVDPDDDHIYAMGMNPKSAVIRTHLWEPNGEVHGPEVMKENLSGGTVLPFYNGGTPLSMASKVNGNIYETIVVSSSNGPWPGTF
ncbi:MAG: Rieske 2Fe-2S domain-containing protein [Conexivisphaerales archaeon]